MDGTLSPIVEDPELAHIHPDAPDVLVEVARAVRAVAIITGRPARQALALGGLDDVGTAIGEEGRELYVFGQYGHERWSSSRRRVVSPRPPQGLGRFLAELPGVLRGADAATAYVEEKGLGVAVHTRRMADPAAAFDRVRLPVSELAARHGLLVEPGRNVVEVRAPGMDKGVAVHTLATELGARAFLFAGDDLGDVEAFGAVDELRGGGAAHAPGLLGLAGAERAARSRRRGRGRTGGRAGAATEDRRGQPPPRRDFVTFSVTEWGSRRPLCARFPAQAGNRAAAKPGQRRRRR